MDSLARFLGWCLWSALWERICARWRGCCLRDWFLLFFFFVPISSDFRAGAAALVSISTIHWSGLCCFQLRNCYLPGGGKKQSGSRCTLRQCTGICSSCHSSARNIFPSVGELSSTWAGFPVLELVLAWSLPCLCTGLLHLIRLY